jgi:hypothetical protein
MVQTLTDGTVSLPNSKAATSIGFRRTFFFEKNGTDRLPLQYSTGSVAPDVSRHDEFSLPLDLCPEGSLLQKIKFQKYVK